MNGDKCGQVPLFRAIDEAEKRLARAERDLEEVLLERSTTEGQATDYGRMTATPHGEYLVNEVNVRCDAAFAAFTRARSELNGLLAELDTWRLAYREPLR
jgi:hypothetical protein